MPSKLHNLVLHSPGTLGLNTQDSDGVQDPRYSIVSNNAVIAKNGLLEARKGAKRTHATAATGTPILDVVYSYVLDDGSEFILSAGGNKIWSGTSPLADETGALTITADDWQFQTYKGEVFGYQSGHAPIFWDGAAATFALLSSKGTAAGLVNSHCHLSAFGRSWVVDTTSLTQINYSDLLVPEDFSTGSSGTIDLDTVWPYTNDTIVAMAAHNNYLIIFGERSIVVYANADDVTNLALVEVIPNMGCVARDSIQNIGDDLFFLANDGVRSLKRTILQDNMPQTEISKDIRDDIIESIGNATLTSVRSTYNEKEGFYIINFPGDKQYICDVRKASEGHYRWTTWTGAFYGLATSNTTSDTLYIGLDGGYLATYDEYNDTDTSTGNVDKTYIVEYKTAWIDSGLQSIKAIWKKAAWYIGTVLDVQFVASWGFEFLETEHSYTANVPSSGNALYGSAVYGTDVYSGGYEKQKIDIPLSGTGSVIRLGAEYVVNGGKVAFNKIDLFMKSGRVT
jgi:hypothetical protein